MNGMLRGAAWQAGAAAVEITPAGRPYLCGYPYVERFAEGVHDPLLASALCISDDQLTVVFVACDLLNLPTPLAAAARERIGTALGIPAAHVMVTATHTHCGPLMVHMVTNDADPNVPRPDPAYRAQVEDAIVQAAIESHRAQRPARLTAAIADATGLGSNRRDPHGPRIARLPVLAARAQDTDELVAVMCVCAMHPTVLHEDWRQISGDFPGLARRWLQRHAVGPRCPIVYHMGASGNQSPRHVVRANTIEEAARLGEVLGREIAAAVDRAAPLTRDGLACTAEFVTLPTRSFPETAEAERRVTEAEAKWRSLRDAGAARAAVRTAEVDWFGSRKALALARAAADGRLTYAARERMPAEIQVLAVGEHVFVGWPGEVFVEFALQVMADHPHATIVTLANGELHGYLVTAEAVAGNGYEASHALFESPASGELLAKATDRLLRAMPPARA